jgi:hypothetical protein
VTGGDERAAVHHLLALISDRPAAVQALAALLVAAGRFDAAKIVAGDKPSKR